jgi:hypothetical protein
MASMFPLLINFNFMKNKLTVLLFAIGFLSLRSQSYCVPAAYCLQGQSPEIQSISIIGPINGIMNSIGTGNLSQGCGTTSQGYSDLSQYTFQGFDAGGLLSLQVNAIDASNTALNVWIDFNNDGDFNDPGECVLDIPPGNNNFDPFSHFFNIPNTVCHQQRTRMRIRLSKTSDIGPNDACVDDFITVGNGETEDWSISFNNPANQLNVVINPSGPIALCQGANSTLTATGAQNYAWSNGLSGNSISVNSTGSYFAVGSTAMGCKDTSNIVSVQVNPLPQISISAGGPLEFCDGGFVNLTATGGVSYQWSTGQSGSSISVQTSGNINAVGTDANGCQNTSNTLSVIATDYPQISSQPGSFQGVVGDQAIFTVQSDAQNHQWQWRNNGVYQNISDGGQYAGTSTNELTVSNLISLNHNSFFRCILSTNDCSDTTNNVKIVLEGVGIGANINSELQIFPNPAMSELVLTLEGGHQKQEVKILDINGRLLKHFFTDSAQTILDISDLKPALYFININGKSFHFIKV